MLITCHCCINRFKPNFQKKVLRTIVRTTLIKIWAYVRELDILINSITEDLSYQVFSLAYDTLVIFKEHSTNITIKFINITLKELFFCCCLAKFGG